MREVIRAALVIARRDYTSTVFSKTFLLFLIGPLLPVIAGVGFAAAGAQADRDGGRATVAVIAEPAEAQEILAARARLVRRIGELALPEVGMAAPMGDPAAQAARLLGDPDRRVVAVLTGVPQAPLLTGAASGIGQVRGDIGLILDTAAQGRAANGAVPPPVLIREHGVGRAAGSDAAMRAATARAGQLVLMVLTIMLAGMLLSNLIEEKSSKVIEVLAAAVPVDAIFLGKLIAMLAMSFTGIAVWGSIAGLGLVSISRHVDAMAAPAVGWPMFVALGLIYFSAVYLLLGALFLGIGGQAASARQVQTLSMPVTMAQVGVVALASAAVGKLDSTLGIVAAIFPWSSPFTMMARAAQRPELWPHAAAIAWQGLWIAIVIRIAAGLFRRSVLKSGCGRRWFRRRA